MATRAAATPAWLASSALDGPYRDLAAWCTAKLAGSADGTADPQDAQGPCGAQGDSVAVRASTVAVQVVHQPGDATAPDCALALHTSAGWFVTAALGACGGGPKYGGSVEIERADLRSLAAGRRPALVLALHDQERAYNETDDGKAFELNVETHGTIACSLAGPAPRCTPLVVSASTTTGPDRDDDAEAFPEVTWSFRLAWPGDGTLVVAADHAPQADASGDSPAGNLAEPPATRPGTFLLDLP